MSGNRQSRDNNASVSPSFRYTLIPDCSKETKEVRETLLAELKAKQKAKAKASPESQTNSNNDNTVMPLSPATTSAKLSRRDISALLPPIDNSALSGQKGKLPRRHSATNLSDSFKAVNTNTASSSVASSTNSVVTDKGLANLSDSCVPPINPKEDSFQAYSNYLNISPLQILDEEVAILPKGKEKENSTQSTAIEASPAAVKISGVDMVLNEWNQKENGFRKDMDRFNQILDKYFAAAEELIRGSKSFKPKNLDDLVELKKLTQPYSLLRKKFVEKDRLDVDDLISIFSNAANFFSFISVINNYLTVLNKFTALEKKYPVLKTQRLDICNSLGIGAESKQGFDFFLIIPVQLGPRYVLLSRSLLEQKIKEKNKLAAVSAAEAAKMTPDIEKIRDKLVSPLEKLGKKINIISEILQVTERINAELIAAGIIQSPLVFIETKNNEFLTRQTVGEKDYMEWKEFARHAVQYTRRGKDFQNELENKLDIKVLSFFNLNPQSKSIDRLNKYLALLDCASRLFDILNTLLEDLQRNTQNCNDVLKLQQQITVTKESLKLFIRDSGVVKDHLKFTVEENAKKYDEILKDLTKIKDEIKQLKDKCKIDPSIKAPDVLMLSIDHAQEKPTASPATPTLR